MLFRGNSSRRHKRYPYLQFITFFPLGQIIAEGCRRGVGVNLSDDGMCMYTPVPILEGQEILINEPPPVSGPKATVRWVKKYGKTGPFYKAGLIFGKKEDGPPPSACREDGLDGQPPEETECVEAKSSFIEDCIPPGKNYSLNFGGEFWSDMSELSQLEAEQLIELSSSIIDDELLEEDAAVRLLRGSVRLRQAQVAIEAPGGDHSDGLGLLEGALIDLRAAIRHDEGHWACAEAEQRMDAAAALLERISPGRTQETLGGTKLKYMEGRIFFRSPFHDRSDREMAAFENIFFNYHRAVRSVEILHKPLGTSGRRFINIVLYGEDSPRTSAGEAADPLCIMRLVEDGTFQLIEDFAAGRQDEEEGAPYQPEPSGEEAGQWTETAGGVRLGKRSSRKMAPLQDALPTARCQRLVAAFSTLPSSGRKTRGMTVVAAGIVIFLLVAAGFLLVSHFSRSSSQPEGESLHGPRRSEQEARDRMSPLEGARAEDASISAWLGDRNGRTGGKGESPVRKETGRDTNRRRRSAGKVTKKDPVVPVKGVEAEEPHAERRTFPPPDRDDL
jgi:hypothetical protein